MYQMEKITTGVSYTTSAVGTGYWLLQLLDKVSVPVGGDRRAGESAVWAADISDEPVFQD